MAAEFFQVWLTFSLMIIGGAVFAAAWAARAGLFKDQERARSLALWAEVAEEEEPEAITAETQRTQRKSPRQS